MKNKKVFLLISLISITYLVGCKKEEESLFTAPDVADSVDKTAKTYPDELLVNHRLASLVKGEKYELRPLRQFNYDGSNLTYISKDPSIASVDANGLVEGLSAGETEITIADKDNPAFATTIKVIVHAKIDQNRATELSDAFKLVNEEDVNSVVDYELYEKTIYKVDGEGENAKETMLSYDRYDQRMSVSYDDAYFRIWETDAEIKTEDGAVDFTNYEWIFYTNAFFDTYVYHQTGDVKNYYRAATQSYMETEEVDPETGEAVPGKRIDPLNDILDNLFVSGHEILTNTVDNSKIAHFNGALGSSDSGTNRLIGSNGDGEVFFQYTVHFDEAADQDDESRYGIPFGTPVSIDQTARYTVKNNRLISADIHLDETYEIDGQSYHEAYDINHLYEEFTKDSLYVPNRKEYTEVDRLFAI